MWGEVYLAEELAYAGICGEKWLLIGFLLEFKYYKGKQIIVFYLLLHYHSLFEGKKNKEKDFTMADSS